ncbi:ABC transporter substrate-binding protein [Clostridium aminobutyricum]|uniref:ABC transporter substrate-binding protein n=1 Tax=Clostridium aminobutyricum TaxID=33953 RepID=A0A939D7R1_CLOAM|nr:ABC transporter substrate-binding protein [Clostridium aminobutyricum]MBN7772610.1 ABC transporter substrate-binding protein [Clostridium aminobutyricum]
MAEMKCKAKTRKHPLLLLGLISLAILLSLPAQLSEACAASDKPIVLKIGNWEEYIDQGDWGDDEAIDLDSETITSKNGLISDFEDWYYDTYGKQVKVEYSTFGTNEDLYSKIILGETYDLVCPSEYMFSKLLKENMLQPLSTDFFDTANQYNYYAKGVSPYIKEIFNRNKIDGKTWSSYAAGYMWGTIGIVYNPEKVSEEDASTWSILANPTYAKRVTIKDSARESYFPALAILNKNLLLSKEFRSSADYSANLAKVLNDTSPQTIEKAEDLLQEIRQNVYAFETDSGKSDMVTGKIVANLQWSGDGVYAMDQAEEEGLSLNYSVPEECTNLWLDGWVMLKSGIKGNPEKQKAAEAFINFISRPDNVIRNMYYIGYTSSISGGDDSLIYEYVKWNYESEDENDTIEYPMGYFFSGDNKDSRYTLTASADQEKRQLFAQYPPKEIVDRSAVMGYFPDDINAKLNQMWINVRCFNFDQVPQATWLKAFAMICLALMLIFAFIYRYKIFRKPIKPGYLRATNGLKEK